MHKVLITGITGFLGSHIAEALCLQGISVIGLKRATSDTWRCKDFENKIEWLDIDGVNDWKKELVQKAPTCIIHTAWIGVEAKDRDNWTEQAKNIQLLIDLLDLSNSLSIEKFVFLGSQAEYGAFEGKINELSEVHPTNAYASIKLACFEILRTYATQHHIEWLWLRIFSVFGERENESWLIPSMIKSMQQKTEMDFTEGKQKYAYLYTKDFAQILVTLLQKKMNPGIYNISSNEVKDLKWLIETIRNKVNPNFKLNFGAIPYRNNQSMHMEGDISKLINEIGPIKFTDFNVALSNTLKYYTSN
ncbi:NAD-dependent epimerase/dehydratase family protein [Pedobacter mendelii]|uniref:CDP-abequose synthase n=1 Tax=Pedobacter mendelii TaxID=1908240 RepID=A0ABQ2BLW1_9SPHI|nr:NAD-dependent epimerase/dehydratase family protein [Pedobacter mendelii]GGI28249.1 CDP-abequose synthase [Pedobacter mendelii]